VHGHQHPLIVVQAPGNGCRTPRTRRW
jgi:hypothetical protein